MSGNHLLPVDVPCAVCLCMIRRWRDGPDLCAAPWATAQGNATAEPCGHTVDEMWLEYRQTVLHETLYDHNRD